MGSLGVSVAARMSSAATCALDATPSCLGPMPGLGAAKSSALIALSKILTRASWSAMGRAREGWSGNVSRLRLKWGRGCQRPTPVNVLGPSFALWMHLTKVLRHALGPRVLHLMWFAPRVCWSIGLALWSWLLCSCRERTQSWARLQAQSQMSWTVSAGGPALPGPMGSWLVVRRHPPWAFLTAVARVLARSKGLRCVWVRDRSACPLLGARPVLGEFEPMPASIHIESVSQEGGACAGLLGPGQSVVVLLLAED